jgi:hypothetical protein
MIALPRESQFAETQQQGYANIEKMDVVLVAESSRPVFANPTL